MGGSSELCSGRHVVVAFVTGTIGPTPKLSEEFGNWLATAGLKGCEVESWELSNIAPPVATSDAPSLFGLAGAPATGYLRAYVGAAVRNLPRSLPPEGLRGACVLDSRLHLGQWKPVDSSGAVHRLAITRCRSGLSRADYADHWRSQHVPLVLSLRPLFLRYVTNVVLDGGVPWDGIVEQDFSSAEDAFEHDRLNREEKTEVRDDIRQLVGGVENYFATLISR